MGKFKPLANGILILSDAPDQSTGLARVARDTATLLATLPQFRVGFLGRGLIGRRKFPFTSYSFPESQQWGEEVLAGVVEDFFGGEWGIVWTNWDPSRLLWLSNPKTLANTRPDLAEAYTNRKWDLWGYFPVDGTGPNGHTLGCESNASVQGFDRVLASSEWGSKVLHGGGRKDCDWLPHGIFGQTFKPVAPQPSKIIVGCVMANQARKDFPVAFHTAQLLRQEYGTKFRFWVHTNQMIGYWNLPALATDYGVDDCSQVTIGLTDSELAWRYSEASATMVPSAAEGFCFPAAEALACGTGAVVTDYAAGQEIVDPEMRVLPIAYRIDTIHNVRRAVLDPILFAKAVVGQVQLKQDDWDYRSNYLRGTVEHLFWDNLQFPWKRWFLKGLK